METISHNNKIYIGRKAGNEILREISNSKKSVKIVSPYLSSSYLEKLVNLQKKGVEITLITCDEIKEDGGRFSNFKLSDIIKQKKIINDNAGETKKVLITISLVIFSISLILFFMSFFIDLFFYLSILLILISLIGIISSFLIKNYKSEYYSIFKLKIFDSHSSNKPWSTNLVHSKIFVIDENIAFLGSANFTYSGFNTHYETIIKIEDKKAIDAISNEVENLFNSTELKSKFIQELGEKVYG